MRRLKDTKHVAVDAGYKIPYIAKLLIDQEIRPVMPYTRPRGKKDFFRKKDYVYDEYHNCYICPNNQILKYSTTNKDDYREYKSDPKICINCPHLSKCTASKNYTKVVIRHIWKIYMEEVEHLRHTSLN